MTANYNLKIKRPPEEAHQQGVFSLAIDYPRSASAPKMPELNNNIQMLMEHNRLVRKGLQLDGVLFPEWSNVFTAWTVEPPQTKEMTSWPEIAAAYNATPTSQQLLKRLYRLVTHDGCDLRGYIPMSSLQFRDKRRALKPLVASGLLRIYDGGALCSGDLVQINPAIVSARDWWSPRQQGAMARSYIDATYYKPLRVCRVNQLDKQDMQIGYIDADMRRPYGTEEATLRMAS
jgi:hypothetical protein